MGLIRPFWRRTLRRTLRRVFLPAFFWCLAGGTYAQNAGTEAGIPVGAELQNLEKVLASPDISLAGRREALIRLARLRQLAGDTEGAAKSWLEAAVISGDDAARVTGAFCLAAMGEWEQAGVALEPVLAKSEGPVPLQARYLDACLKAWTSGNLSSLIILAERAEYAALRPSIYYTLWKTLSAGSGVSAAVSAENWKTRLLAEFPRSPEGRIAASAVGAANGEAGGASGLISARPSPLWLLLPGRNGFTFSLSTGPVSAEIMK
jgi:hypothetical protein